MFLKTVPRSDRQWTVHRSNSVFGSCSD